MINFYEEKNAMPPWGHVLQQTRTIFELIQDIIRTNEKFPFPGSQVFQPNGTIFKLVQNIIGTNILTMFHDDWTINVASRVLTNQTINVASRVLTRQMLTTDNGQKAITKAHHEHIVHR
ncbi:hypothetical protein DPMN_122694 [Dreissena polymorpha]|uniref:Uncharacterized protein n=1 Tax=Dreissena polymorpha TaxID=45954 RepID=A0A9D4JUQ3_DREPO|nr:hypothetical protein DPMN_122694 [Dreissena polymorpha]